MSKRNDIYLVNDMLESALKIRFYTEGLTFDEYIADDKTVDAVIRNFENI